MLDHVDTGLLVMDMQEEILARFGEGAALEPLQSAIAAARSGGIPVIYVKVAFRAGYPEASSDNKSFSQIAQSGGLLVDSTRIHEALAPQPGDIEVIKKRVSAFAGSDLEIILRARGIRTLVLTGIATSGVVLSTLRAAADLDFRIVVLSDCCWDRDDEVHRVLLEKVFPRQAEVMEAEQWRQQLGG